MFSSEAVVASNVEMIVARRLTSSTYCLEQKPQQIPNSKLVRMTGLVRISIPTGRGMLCASLVAYREADTGAVMIAKEQAQSQFPQIQFNS